MQGVTLNADLTLGRCDPGWVLAEEQYLPGLWWCGILFEQSRSSWGLGDYSRRWRTIAKGQPVLERFSLTADVSAL